MSIAEEALVLSTEMEIVKEHLWGNMGFVELWKKPRSLLYSLAGL